MILYDTLTTSILIILFDLNIGYIFSLVWCS